MLEFICLFFPAIISLSLWNIKKKKKFSLQDFIITYSIFIVIINFSVLLILYFYLDNNFVTFNSSLFSVNFALKFMSLAIFLSLIYSIIPRLLVDNKKEIIKTSNKYIKIIKDNINIRIKIFKNK